MDSYIWQAAPYSWKIARRLAEELDVPLLVGIVLARRGFTDAGAARRFLEVDPVVPDPFLFSAMEDAVGLLDDAISRGRRVVVHGDYDVDGISGTALLVRGLERFGLEAEPYLPSRFVHGYGLSAAAVKDIAKGGDALLITVDCGIAYPEEVALAREAGLDVLVTDHHRPGDRLPEAVVIHPDVGSYPGHHLCGAGIAFKLMHGLHSTLEGADRQIVPPSLESELDLVALATVADLVPLVGENRYYVREGLVRLGMTDKPGLRQLMAVCRSDGRPDTETIAFRLGPRLNAAGRIEDPQKPLRLLLTGDDREARTLAEELDTVNRQRQEVERRIFDSAVGMVEDQTELPAALVLDGTDWHEGVIGIVASRIVERYHRPAILLARKNGMLRGSGRSIPPYDLMDGLRACEEWLDQYGGHAQAAGMSILPDSVHEFRRSFTEHATARLGPRELRRAFAPDAIVRGRDINLEAVDAIERLAPFGMGNPKIHLLAVGSQLEGPSLTRTGDHLRCNVRLDGVATRAIGFRLGSALPAVEANPHCHAGLLLQTSEWNGSTRAEVQLHSLYRAESLGEESLGCSPGCPFLDDLSASPSCDRCADPYGQVSSPRPLVGEDVRGEGGYLSYIAQVLSSGEPACVIGSSVPHRMGPIAGRLPLRELGVAGVDCVSRTCWRTRLAELRKDALLFLDWPAAERRVSLALEKRHALVVDPPYRAGHTALLEDLERAGVTVHHVYGVDERELTAQILQLTLHPRAWMALLYRSQMSGMRGAEAWPEIVRQAWERYRVLPASDELRRAEDILESAGIGRDRAEKSTIDLRRIPAYAASEAMYEEALRLCRSL